MSSLIIVSTASSSNARIATTARHNTLNWIMNPDTSYASVATEKCKPAPSNTAATATKFPDISSPMILRALFLTTLFICLSIPVCATEPVMIGKFSSADISDWNQKSFKGKTSYTLVKDNGRTILKAHSNKAASGYIKKISVDPKRFPLLRWSWKVAGVNPKEDITQKSGDDFVARVYVVFPRTFFWRMRAINYVWSSRMPKESVEPSPYTGNVKIVAVESGPGKAGEWISEERNIYEDYRRLFGEEPPEIGAIAVMTDTDNTQTDAVAWYGDITLYSTPSP